MDKIKELQESVSNPHSGFEDMSDVPEKKAKLSLTPSKYNANFLSVCTITRVEDFPYLPNLFSSLPIGCEFILVITGKGQESKLIKEEEVNGIKVKIFTYGYEEFSFSDAKNHAKKHATREWVLFLDSDERLFFSPEALNSIPNIPRSVGALEVDNHIKTTKPDMTTERATASQIRLMRNRTNIKYTGRVHESVLESLVAGGYEIGEISLDIIHVGYYASSKEQAEAKQKHKLYRNYNLLIKDLIEDSKNLSKMEYMRKTLDSMKYLKLIPDHRGFHAH